MSIIQSYLSVLGIFFAGFLLILAPNAHATQAKCTWLYLVTQGGISVNMHHTHWQLSKCPSGLVSYFAKGCGRTAMDSSYLQYTLNVTSTPSFAVDRRRFSHVDIIEACDEVVALPHSSATIYYVVEPVQTDLSVQSGASTITPSMWYTDKRIHTPTGTLLSINPLAGVDICPDPSLEILTQNKGHHFNLAKSTSGEPVLNFAANSKDAKEGEFVARIRVTCIGSPRREFVFDQIVVVIPASNCSLSGPHSFGVDFHTPQDNTISVDDSRVMICVLEGLPHHNGDMSEPSSDKLGGLAPGGQTAKIDLSALKIRCGEQDYPPFGSSFLKTMSLLEDPQPGNVCPGVFDYEYELNADGTFDPKLSSLTARASGQPSSFCPMNQFTNASFVTQPKAGSISSPDASQGTFLYIPFTSAPVGMDSFDFTLKCTASPFKTCKATARISIFPTPDSSTIYHDKSNLITCKGSCVKGNSTRKDGRAVGSIDFDFSQNGNLLIYAYMTLDSLQSHFVTFSPFKNGSSYLTSASTPNETLLSFEPSCLDRQSAWGKANDVFLPDGKGLNLLKNNYKFGDNYYQKFGGMHQNCDIYRENPCKFAPFMTPNTHSNIGGTQTVTWRLYVDDCDATYVGIASVESLRVLRNSDGTSTFKLTGDTVLKGAVYMNTLSPVSLESPDQGFIVHYKAYDLNVNIRSTITVHTSEVKEAGNGAVHIISDIQYAFGKDATTNERLYAYSIHMYPRRIVDNKMISVDPHDVSVQSSSLVYFEFASPNRLECPECTGTRMRCKGLGFGFATDCGKDGIVTFEEYKANKFSFSHPSRSGDNAYVFPRIMTDIGSYYELIFTLRVNGRNSYNSVDAAPAGSFVIHVRLSNGQVFSVRVAESDYVSLINNHCLRSRMCTASPYWPVPDVLGNSTPVSPFKPFYFANDTGMVVNDDYSMPQPLRASMSNLSFPFMHTDIYSSPFDGIMPNDDKDTKTSLCAYEQEHIFGVRDWVFVTIPSIKKKRDGTIVTSGTLSSTAYTVAELQYILLKVPLNETIAVKAPDLKTYQYLNVLLEGSLPLTNESIEDQADEYPFISNKMGRYYWWKEVAPFLKYRRISYAAADSSGQTVTVPFSFAFTPGSLLHRDSSLNVPIYLQVSIKFTTFEGNAGNTRVVDKIEDKILYIFHVSHGISAATQFHTQAYKIAMIKLEGTLNQKSATTLFVLLLIAVIGTLLASVYIEAEFKVIIYNSKYLPKNTETFVVDHDNRVDNFSNSLDADRHGTISISSPCVNGGSLSINDNKGYSAPIKTKFGILGTEQQRVAENDDEEFKSSNGTVRSTRMGKSPICEEEKRVQDDEIAEF